VAVTPQLITVPDYCRRPRVLPISLICIHATRGDAPMDVQYQATVDWFTRAPNLGGFGPTADIVIGAQGERAEVVGWRETHSAFAAGYGGKGSILQYAVDEVAIAIEVAQPAWQEPYTDAAIAELVEFLRPIVAEFQIPLVHVGYWDQDRYADVPRGFLGHEDTANGNRLGKSDPGPLFPWDELFNRLAAQPPAIDLTPFGEGDGAVEIRELDQGESISALNKAAAAHGGAINDQGGLTVVEVVAGSPVQPPPGGRVFLFTTRD